MKIREHKLDDVTILELEGQLTKQGNVRFRESAAAAIQDGARKLILNLAQVEYIDGNGVGALTACFITLRQMNGRIKLLHPNDRVQRVLAITKLINVFETFDSESAAIASYVDGEEA